MPFRTERDTMGEMQVPDDALYGASTARAVENFPISGVRFPRAFLRALGVIKAAAARVNARTGTLTAEKGNAIEKAARAVAEGRHDSHFPLDIYQTGSGTSTNTNANEVIARLAGAHPNDDVNRGQSSNDVFPAAIHVSSALRVSEALIPALRQLEQSLDRKAKEFHGVLKIGRTHLQDAVPMRMGQEFSGYAHQVRAATERIEAALLGIYELPLGGTAIGTGLNAAAGFGRDIAEEIAKETGLPFVEARNHFEAQASKDAAVFLSGALRNAAVGLTKIANDIRWLGSGPRCGIGELRLPAVQPGSSIMPGKVNPVIAESLLMVCAQVIGHDAAIAWCGAGGNFELNVMMPLIALDLLDSIELLASAARNFASKLVDGLEADVERATGYIEHSLAMCTALAPEIGYERAAAIAKEAFATNRTVREVARDKSGIDAARLGELLDPASQTGV